MDNNQYLSLKHKMDIGNRLRDFRTKKHLTQEHMAEILGVSRTFYGQVERGVSSLSIGKILTLSDTLNADIGYILTGKKYYHIELPNSTSSIPDSRLDAIRKIINLIVDMP